MNRLMTKHFAKWASKQNLAESDLSKALDEVQEGIVEANLGGYLYKKRIRFQGQGKSGSGRTIICYKKNDKSIFIHGFSKNEKSNLSAKELVALKEFAKILLDLSDSDLEIAIRDGALQEIKK